jgi:hypothetical protein
MMCPIHTGHRIGSGRRSKSEIAHTGSSPNVGEDGRVHGLLIDEPKWGGLRRAWRSLKGEATSARVALACASG